MNATSASDPAAWATDKVVIRILPTSESIKHFLGLLIDLINELPDGNFTKNPTQRKRALTNKINDIISMIETEDPAFYSEAYDKMLHDIKPKLSGLKTDEKEVPWGNGVFKNPWISSPDNQVALREFCNFLLTDIKTWIEIQP